MEIDVAELNEYEDNDNDKGKCEHDVGDPAWTLLSDWGR